MWKYLKTIKAPLGYIVGLMAAGAEVKGQSALAVILLSVATWLHGAGSAASDREAKARQ